MNDTCLALVSPNNILSLSVSFMIWSQRIGRMSWPLSRWFSSCWEGDLKTGHHPLFPGRDPQCTPPPSWTWTCEQPSGWNHWIHLLLIPATCRQPSPGSLYGWRENTKDETKLSPSVTDLLHIMFSFGFLVRQSQNISQYLHKNFSWSLNRYFLLLNLSWIMWI